MNYIGQTKVDALPLDFVVTEEVKPELLQQIKSCFRLAAKFNNRS